MSNAPRLRIFVAADLPAGVRERLARWGRRASAGHADDLRLLSPNDLHVTLCFLGWREEREIESVVAVARECAAAPAPRLAVAGAVWLPVRRPRVLAVDLDDLQDALRPLQARLASALVERSLYEPEQRPYRPHVTVGRVRGGARLRPFALEDPPALEFAAAGVTVYRSRLERAGARYEPLGAIEP